MVKIKEDAIKVTHDGVSGALGVALTLLAVIQTGGKLGACYNPAVAITLMCNGVAFLDNSFGYLTHYTPYYFVGPLLGGALAGLFHLMHHDLLLDAEKEADRDADGSFSHDVKDNLLPY